MAKKINILENYGYYWVRHKKRNRWVIAQYDKCMDAFISLGLPGRIAGRSECEVDERIILRNTDENIKG